MVPLEIEDGGNILMLVPLIRPAPERDKPKHLI